MSSKEGMLITEPDGVPAPPSLARGVRTGLIALIPIGLLVGLLAVFTLTDPLAVLKTDLPSLETLSVGRIVVTTDGFQVPVMNGSPDPVTIAQVAVDDAYWNFTIQPTATLPRLGEAMITLTYPWVAGEPHIIKVLTASGTPFEGQVGVATETPQPALPQFLAYGLLGVYVGIVPVLLGMAWFPAMRQLSRRGLNAILALTVGLLVFLLVDTLQESFEVSADLPAIFQGSALTLFVALLTWLTINAVSGRRQQAGAPAQQRQSVATMIALSIGLHNLGEGLAIGAAFALGEAALGSFLVIGFTLHNITEGIGIVAPLTRDRPKISQLVGLALLAGGPAMLGAWIGGFAYSPLLAVLFLSIGAGAIAQVVVEVGRLLLRDATKAGESVMNWANVGGLALGLALMYGTAFFVKF